MVFGLAVTVLAVITRPGVGSFGLVPEAMAGLTSILLGAIEVLMARPPRAVGWNRLVGWIFLAAAVVATVSVVILAIDDLAGPLESNRRLAQVVVVAGRSVVLGGMVILVVALIFGAIGIALGWILAAWRSRWLR
jgi:hypothetical protein